MKATKMTNLQDFIKAKEEIARRTGVQVENVQIEGAYCYVLYNCPAAHHADLWEDIEEILGLVASDLLTDEHTPDIYIDGQQVNVQQYLQTMQTPCAAEDEIIIDEPLDETGELTDEQFAELLFKPRDYACVERMGW